jgi:3-oxoacyl-[acyl-carrier protein] reductase
LESSKLNVLIIGGSGGLGQELARLFLKNNHRVALHFFQNKDRAESVLREFGFSSHSEESFICQADIRDEKEVEKMFQDIRKKWVRMDVLINNAGAIDDAPAANMTENQWNRIIQINLTGLFFCMKFAAQWMKTNQKGHIINLASRSGLTGRAGQANYASAKAAVIALTKSAAKEWGADQIRVNAILPGLLPTAMGLKIKGKHRERIILENVLQKTSTIEEVSGFIYFLSNMESVSGQVFNLDSRIL